MNAVKLQVVVPESREVTINLPAEMLPGPAEIIVISNGDDRGLGMRGSLSRVLGTLERIPQANPGMSKQEIEAFLAEERSSWGD